VIHAVFEAIALATDDRFADAEDGVFTLFDVFHQLHRRAQPFADVIADVAIGGAADQQAAVGRADAKLRNFVLVQEGLPLASHLAEIDVRLDQARLSGVVAQAGARIELADRIDRALHQVHWAIQGASDLLELIRLNLLQVLAHDLLGERVI